LTAQKSNSNTVWFNFQTYIYIYIYAQRIFHNHILSRINVVLDTGGRGTELPPLF